MLIDKKWVDLQAIRILCWRFACYVEILKNSSHIHALNKIMFRIKPNYKTDCERLVEKSRLTNVVVSCRRRKLKKRREKRLRLRHHLHCHPKKEIQFSLEYCTGRNFTHFLRWKLCKTSAQDLKLLRTRFASKSINYIMSINSFNIWWFRLFHCF